MIGVAMKSRSMRSSGSEFEPAWYLAIAAGSLASGSTAHRPTLEYTCFSMAALNAALALACHVARPPVYPVCVWCDEEIANRRDLVHMGDGDAHHRGCVIPSYGSVNHQSWLLSRGLRAVETKPALGCGDPQSVRGRHKCCPVMPCSVCVRRQWSTVLRTV